MREGWGIFAIKEIKYENGFKLNIFDMHPSADLINYMPLNVTVDNFTSKDALYAYFYLPGMNRNYSG